MPAAISAVSLFKSYAAKPPVEAVRGIDLEVMEGECFGLLGPNGAGKTTTMEMLEGLLEPTSGTIEILNFRWGRDDAVIRGLIVVMGIGGATFGGMGLLLASRVKTSEAIGGLMNLIMLPMWIVGGGFFQQRAISRPNPTGVKIPAVRCLGRQSSIDHDGRCIHQYSRRTALGNVHLGHRLYRHRIKNLSVALVRCA